MLISAPIAVSTSGLLALLAVLAAACAACAVIARWNTRPASTARQDVSKPSQSCAKHATNAGGSPILSGPRVTVCDMSSLAAPTAPTVQVSEHAANQYQHRVKPGLEPDTACRELERLAALGNVTASPPAWINAKDPAPYWLALADAIVLPLKPQDGRWIATTCVTQQTLTPARRDAKTTRKILPRSLNRARRRAG